MRVPLLGALRDPVVRLVVLARAVPLLAAPAILWLVATHARPDEQGLYFIFFNVQAVAALFELGVGTLIVQFASHEAGALHWTDTGALAGEPEPMARAAGLLAAALRWYGAAAACIAITVLPLGYFGFQRAGVSVATYATPWLVTLAGLCVSLLLAPFVCFAEGAGHVAAVQRLRVAQALAAAVILCVGIPRLGALPSVAVVAVLSAALSAGWLFVRHRPFVARALHDLVRRDVHAPASLGGFAAAQHRAGIAWIAPFLASQLLGPIVLLRAGAGEAGRLGMALAIAGAPLTLGSALLHARLPQYAASLARDGATSLDRLARRVGAEAIVACALCGVGAVAIVAVVTHAVPRLAPRVLPLPVLTLLCLNSVAGMTFQVIGAYLRAWRAERLAAAAAIGSTFGVTGAVLLAGSLGGAGAAYAYAFGGVAIMLPIAGAILVTARRGVAPANTA